jgi:integrase
MAKLGNPVEGSSLPVITLGQLADKYGDWMKREVEAGRVQPRTLDYYQDHIQKFLDAVGGQRPALGVMPHEVEMFKTSWHSVQTVQRLYNWGVEMGLLRENPIRSVKKPDLGQREHVLTLKEENKLLDGTDKHFHPFLVALLHTIARPQEVRALQWKHLVLEPVPMFVLTDFKAKKRRKDRKTAVRRSCSTTRWSSCWRNWPRSPVLVRTISSSSTGAASHGRATPSGVACAGCGPSSS